MGQEGRLPLLDPLNGVISKGLEEGNRHRCGGRPPHICLLLPPMLLDESCITEADCEYMQFHFGFLTVVNILD